MVDVAASIIGIIAAAGKVAETLTPMISVLKDVHKHAAIVLTEVNACRTILSELDVFLKDLDALPEARKDLIPVNSLVTTFTDGVLLFSELESLVGKLDHVNNAISRRVKRAWNHSEVTALLARLQNFKASISAMLSILNWYGQSCFLSPKLLVLTVTSRSELEARSQHAVLITANANLLDSVAELSRRLDNYSLLQDAYSSRLSLVNNETKPSLYQSTSADLQDSNDNVSIWSSERRHSFEKDLDRSSLPLGKKDFDRFVRASTCVDYQIVSVDCRVTSLDYFDGRKSVANLGHIDSGSAHIINRHHECTEIPFLRNSSYRSAPT